MRQTFACLLVLPLVVFAGEASAITRLQTDKATCASVRALLRSEGEAILRWSSRRNPGLPLYGRYVSSGRFCGPDESAVPAYVPSKDNPSCVVRQCELIEFEDRFFSEPR